MAGSRQTNQYTYHWVWSCHACRDISGMFRSSGMTTEILQCPEYDCGHRRCPECEHEQVKQRDRTMAKGNDIYRPPNAEPSKAAFKTEVGTVNMTGGLSNPPFFDAPREQPSRRSIPSAEWEMMRPKIQELYIHENKTFSEVANALKNEFNVLPTKHQFSKKMNAWGMRMNPNPTERVAIVNSLEGIEAGDELERAVPVLGPVNDHKEKLEKITETPYETMERDLSSTVPSSTREGFLVSTITSRQTSTWSTVEDALDEWHITAKREKTLERHGAATWQTRPESLSRRKLQNAELDDIRSVISVEDDIQSTAPGKGSIQEWVAEQHLATLFSQNDDLRALFQEALGRIGKERLVENFRRILKQYFLHLSEIAKSNLEGATSNLLRSKWSRIRIGQQLVKNLSPENDENPLVIEKQSQGLVDLEKWLESNPGFAPPEDPLEPPEETIDDSNSDSGDSDTGQEFELPKIAEMEDFLLRGSPFNTLLVNLRTFIFPVRLAPLTRIIMSLPSDQIWFSQKDEKSMWNGLKCFLEDRTEQEWDWWPFSPRMRRLRNGETRIHWRCYCNTHLWTEISSEHAEGYKLLLKKRATVESWKHICRRRTKELTTPTNTGGHTEVSEPDSSPGRKSGTSGSASSSQSPFSPSSLSRRSRSSSQGTSVSDGGAEDQASAPHDNQERLASAPPSTGTVIIMPKADERVVLFGVKGTRRTLDLAQICANMHNNDQAFFVALRRSYKANRGFWRYWFSISQLRFCDFVKFEKFRKNRIVARDESMPDDEMYEYIPKPAKELPPISRHEFEMNLIPCRSWCFLKFFHDCVEEPSPETRALCRIPKRKAKFEIEIDKREFAWGINAGYKISFLYMLIYHVLIFAGTFSIWAWWLKWHPGDLQNAAVPFTTVAVLLSFFWGAAGVFNFFESGKDSVESKSKGE